LLRQEVPAVHSATSTQPIATPKYQTGFYRFLVHVRELLVQILPEENIERIIATHLMLLSFGVGSGIDLAALLRRVEDSCNLSARTQGAPSCRCATRTTQLSGPPCEAQHNLQYYY